MRAARRAQNHAEIKDDDERAAVISFLDCFFAA